ncbi:MAG TPA: hypothetical protein VFP65_07615 [Anaeromyxobacteraceae bacterium]|nr:hypothetical protein [Anaeromyxobacteraceae bacterium]
MDEVDRERYPRVAAYLGALPDGVRSYPECQAKAAIVRRILHDRPVPAPPPGGLPERLAEVLHAPPLESEWMPEVLLMATVLTVADDRALEDDAFLRWVGPVNRELFGGIYGLVMSVLTPEFAARNASSYWKMFHRGSSLVPERAGARHWSLRLLFPRHLFSGLALRQYGPVIQVGFQFADPSATVVLREEGPESARFDVTWGGGGGGGGP